MADDQEPTDAELAAIPELALRGLSDEEFKVAWSLVDFSRRRTQG